MRRTFFLCLTVGSCSLVLVIIVCQNLLLDEMPNSTLSLSLSSYPDSPQRKRYRGVSWGEWSTYEEFCVWSLSSRENLQRSDEGVTLCTQGTPEYLYHISELCSRWDGPISVAVYAPEEFRLVKKMIYKFRQCNPCVRTLVSWYVFYESGERCPTKSHLPTVTKPWNCGDSTYLKTLNRKRKSPYPINVARNLARTKATTYFILSLDIELYPSHNIAPRFLKMMDNDFELHGISERRVWVLPVFEVDSSVEAPRDKSQLRELFSNGKAISFHKFRCVSCHRVPNLKQWMKVTGHTETLQVVQTVKRDKGHGLQDWEPFYIGTEHEPYFDNRLSWEGKQNKMQVAFEMCILDYEFSVLDDAFLVHTPGINKYDARKEVFRAKYMSHNNRIIKQIKEELKSRFPNATGC